MKQHTINRRFFALLFSLAFVLLALPSMAFAAGSDTQTETSVASVTSNSTDYTYYSDLQEAISAASSNGTVTLLQNVTTEATLTITGTVTLDLDGYGITYNNSEATASVITVSSGTFTLQDSNTANSTKEFADPTSSTGETITVTGGYITGGTGNSSDNGGGVYVSSGATFVMNGGTIVGNTATYNGGGVYVTGIFTMNGGTIVGNTATYNGGGVYVKGGNNYGTFYLYGGSITENTVTFNYGAGVYVGSATNYDDAACFIIGDGTGKTITITDNTRTSSTITNNVYLEQIDSYADANITVAAALSSATTSIGVTIENGTGNIVTAGAAATGVFFADNTDYHVNESVSADSKYTYTLITAVASVTVGSGNDASTNYFATIEAAVTAANAVADTTEAAPATIKLLDDVAISDTLDLKTARYITLDLAGNTITNNGTSAALYVQEGTTLTLTDSGGGGTIDSDGAGYGVHVYSDSGTTFIMEAGTITGGSTTYGGGVYVNGGVIEMTGGTISGNTATTFGGGVYVTASGSFTMTGGSIRGNTANSNGGGVHVNSGSFTMSGGSISGNNANSNGGGVYVTDSGSFTMRGGTIGGEIVTDANTAITSGGGVYTNGAFTMTGGSITGNSVPNNYSNGGGVYINSGSFTLGDTEDGVDETTITITGNTKNGADNNVQLNNNVTITVADDISSTGSIGVTRSNTYGDITTAGKAATSVFFADNASYVVTETKDETSGDYTYAIVLAVASVTVDGSTIKYLTIEEAVAAAKAVTGKTATITLMTSGITITESITFDSGDIVLNLAGFGITYAGTEATAAVIAIDGATLTITGEGIITGGAYGVLVTNGTLSLDGAGTIAGNTTYDVSVAQGASLCLSGALTIGTIDGDALSGGIYLADGAVISVTDLLKEAALVLTTENEPTESDPVAVASGSNYTLTATDLAAFTSTSTTTDVVLSLAADGNIYLVIVPDTTSSTTTVKTYYIINLGTNGYGSIAPVVSGYDYALVAQGDAAVFSFIPMDGYEIYEVYINGEAIGAQSFYSITSASANVTIYVEFAPAGTLAIEAAAAAAAGSTGTTPQDDVTDDSTTTEDIAEDATAGDGTAEDAMQVEPEGSPDDSTAEDTAAPDDTTPDSDTTQADGSNAGGITLPAALGLAALALAAVGGFWWFIAKKKGEDED